MENSPNAVKALGEFAGDRPHDHPSHDLALNQLSNKLHINSRWIRTTTSRTEIWYATNYTMELFLLVAPEGIEPSLTDPQPVVLPSYHRAKLRRLKDFGPIPLLVFKTGTTDHRRQTSCAVTRERLELPTPTFVASCSNPTELTSQKAETERYEPLEPFGSAH